MITKDWKVSTLLDTYPQTLDVLLAASPHFKKLNNNLLRKTLAPRVSIEQASSIGGVNAEHLLAALNEYVGATTSSDIEKENVMVQEAKAIEKPEFLNHLSTEREVVLDVRPILAGGTDPFKTIVKTVKLMNDEQVLHLINSFEPIPLYGVLGERDLDHWTERVDDVWHIYFYKSESPSSAQTSPKGVLRTNPEPRTAAEPDVIELDVRGLEPPEPMMRILEALSRVGENTILLVHHHREPMMLYDKLEERGFMAVANKIEEGYYKVVIRKK